MEPSGWWEYGIMKRSFPRQAQTCGKVKNLMSYGVLTGDTDAACQFILKNLVSAECN